MIRILSVLMALSPLCLIGPAEAHRPDGAMMGRFDWGQPDVESTRADTFALGFGAGLGSVDPVERLLQGIETYAQGDGY